MFHQLTRRTVLGGLISTAALPNLPAAAKDLRLIAHRGGVVDEGLAENSAASLEEAIRRGYWMAEVDVRRSKDGVLVVNHDADFQKYFGDPRRLEEMSWEEMKGLRATPGGARPLAFAELCAVAKGRIRLMLDLKVRQPGAEFYRSLVESMKKNDLLDSAYALGGPELAEFIPGGIRFSLNPKAVKGFVEAKKLPLEKVYLFDLASLIGAGEIAVARELGIPIVAAVNTFRYAGQDHMKAATADLVRLRGLGVKYFQTDSVYDPALL